MKREQMATMAGFMFLLAGFIGGLAGLWRQYHATNVHEAMASWMSPLFLALGLMWLAIGRKYRKSSERS